MIDRGSPPLGLSWNDTTFASDSYYKFLEIDIPLAASLGVEQFSFTVPWSRTLSKTLNDDLENPIFLYRSMVERLLSYGIEPIVVLVDSDYPSEIALASETFVEQYMDHVRFVCEELELCGLVKRFITFYDPFSMIYNGYVDEIWPPGEGGSDLVWEVFYNILRAHGEAYEYWLGFLVYIFAIIFPLQLSDDSESPENLPPT